MLEYFKTLGLVSVITTIGITGLVYLLRRISDRWIDSSFHAREEEAKQAHSERLSEIEHRYKLLQQRESVKYERIFEARYDPILSLGRQAGKVRSSAYQAMLYITIVQMLPDLKPTLEQYTNDFRDSLLALNASFEGNQLLFGPNFIEVFQSARKSAWDVYRECEKLLKGKSTHDEQRLAEMGSEIGKQFSVLDASIREHIGSEVI